MRAEMEAVIHRKPSMFETKPDNGAVPESSSRNRYANKRMLIICGAIVAVIVLVVILRVMSSMQT
jgi:hypothetical protein